MATSHHDESSVKYTILHSLHHNYIGVANTHTVILKSTWHLESLQASVIMYLWFPADCAGKHANEIKNFFPQKQTPESEFLSCLFSEIVFWGNFL